MTQAFLITLSGMGDHEWKLIDAQSMAYLQAVLDWDRADPAPTPPPALVDAVRAAQEDEGGYEDTVEEFLAVQTDSSSPDNDLAMVLPASRFGGETFTAYTPSPNALQEFVRKHNLELVEAYDGYLY